MMDSLAKCKETWVNLWSWLKAYTYTKENSKQVYSQSKNLKQANPKFNGISKQSCGTGKMMCNYKNKLVCSKRKFLRYWMVKIQIFVTKWLKNNFRTSSHVQLQSSSDTISPRKLSILTWRKILITSPLNQVFFAPSRIKMVNWPQLRRITVIILIPKSSMINTM